jgi:hypothetical protein
MSAASELVAAALWRSSPADSCTAVGLLSESAPVVVITVRYRIGVNC